MNRSFFILKTSCPFLKLFKKKKNLRIAYTFESYIL